MKKFLIPILLGVVLILIGLIVYFLVVDRKDYSELESINDTYYIEDRTEECAEALEEIYRDKTYIYYLSCIKSETIFVINKQTKNEYTLRYAMDNGLVTIDELKNTTVAIYEDERILGTVYITGDNINFREDHSVSADIINGYQLHSGEIYSVLDMYEDDKYTWYKIEYKGELGWFANNGSWASFEELDN